MTEEKNTHESYGVLHIGRRTTHPAQAMFGSQIRTSNPIAIEIHQAEVVEDAGRQWIWGRNKIIEIELTPAQFADAITSLNVGDGVPCTIRWIKGHGPVEDGQYTSAAQVHIDHLQERIDGAIERADELAMEAKTIIDGRGSMKVDERRRLAGLLAGIIQEIKTNIPWIAGEAYRVLDKAKAQAKAEIEAFATNAIVKAGLKQLTPPEDTIDE